MPNFESPSINKIFENRKDFISEVGKQLEKETKAEVEIGGEKLNIDYRAISIESQENKDGDAVVLLPGFGSGWEGISELGFSLACEGRKVVMPSLPGYGNSDNPSESYYKTGNFDNKPEVINQLIGQIGLKEGRKVHLIGHSMGSEIMATFAQKYPERVSSLVLLNPAGVNEEENKIALAKRFFGSGIKTDMAFKIRKAFSGEKDYEKEIWKHIPKTESPLAKERLPQRLAEVNRLSEGHLLEKLKDINCPITYISGQLDTVYPPGKEDDENSQVAKVIESVEDKTRIEKSVMTGLRHNTTIAPDEITAANIEHYLEKAEKFEHIHTAEEVSAIFKEIIGEAKFEEGRKLEDEQGLYLWEIKIIQEDGGSVEYEYVRKGNYKERGLPGGVAPETAIHMTLFDSEGIPYTGHPVRKFLDGKWIEIS